MQKIAKIFEFCNRHRYDAFSQRGFLGSFFKDFYVFLCYSSPNLFSKFAASARVYDVGGRAPEWCECG